MNKKSKQNFLRLFIIVILLLALHYSGLIVSVENRLFKVFSPVQAFFFRVGSNFGQLFQATEIKEENQKLKDQLAQLSIDYIKLSSLELENKYLRSELNFLKETKRNFKLVKVIGRQANDDQILIIDHGSADGLEVGQAVTVGQGIIIGKILKTEDNQGQVMLLTHINCKLAVGLANYPSTSGLLKGQAGNSLLMDLIPLNQEIKEGDTVITSGLETKIPSGLVIGQVSQVNNLIGQIFKQAKVSQAFSYQGFYNLTVILP